MYSFEGEFRKRPEQNLAGASKKLHRTTLLQKAAEEREERRNQRVKIRSTIVIQSFCRGYLTRKHEYGKYRHEFDTTLSFLQHSGNDITAKQIEFLLHRFTLFYSVKQDGDRLNWISQQVIKQNKMVMKALKNSPNEWLLRIKRLLMFNIQKLDVICHNDQSSTIAIPLRVIEIYTTPSIYCETDLDVINILTSVWRFLVIKGFFQFVRGIIDKKVPEPYEETIKAPTPLASSIFDFIMRPLQLQTRDFQTRSIIVTRFFNELLKGPFSAQIKLFVIPSITKNIPVNLKAETIFSAILKSDQDSYEDTILQTSKSIWNFYSLATILSNQILQLNEKDISRYLLILRCLSEELRVHTLSNASKNDVGDEADEDEEAMIVDQNDSQTISEKITMNLCYEILNLLNQDHQVQIIASLIDNNKITSNNLNSLCWLCYSMLTSNGLAVNQYRMLYTLAFKAKFLRLLWQYITTVSTPSVFGSPTPLLNVLCRGLNLAAVEWQNILPQLTLFSALFSYMLPTLDDVEFYENDDVSKGESRISSVPFTLRELTVMSSTLKDVCVGLIEMAYHDNRANARNPSTMRLSANTQSEVDSWKRLFKCCVKLLRQLHLRDSRRHYCPPDHWISKQIAICVEKPTSFEVGVQQRRRYRQFVGLRHLTREELETEGPPLSTTEIRNVTILQEIPFVVSFQDRVKILQTFIRQDKEQNRGDRHSFLVPGSMIQVSIRRNYIYEDAFDKLSHQNEPNLKPDLRVQLVNAVGLDEAGIDGGGIFREFLSELLKTGFDPNRGFFRYTQDRLLYPNPAVNMLHENPVMHYYFIGRMLGKAIYENMLVEIPFASFFLAKVLARHSGSDVDIHNLSSLDPLMYKNLVFLKNYDGDVSELNLDFTVVDNELGANHTTELKPNGAQVPVTQQNRIEYIHLMADYKLNKQIRSQCAAFKQGLSNVIELDWLRMFNPRELQTVISGALTPIDLQDLRRNTNYAGGYSDDHAVINTFWKVVNEFDENQKRKLLKFVTSCSRPPLLGFKDLYPAFCIQNAGKEPDRLPTASTCMNLLKLPEFRNEEVMRKKLQYALESGSGFELS